MTGVQTCALPILKEVVIIVAVGEERVEEVEEVKTETTMKGHLCWLDVLVNVVAFISAATTLVLTIWGSCQIPKAKRLSESYSVLVFIVVLMGVVSLYFAGMWLHHLIQITSTEKRVGNNRS